MRVYYDCEFLDDGSSISLISIGMVAEDGREYYAVNSDAPWDRIKQHDWLVRNVLPPLPVINRNGLDAYVRASPNVHPRPTRMRPTLGSQTPSPNVHPRPTLVLVDVDTTHTQVRPHWVIANEVRDFLAATPDVELWAWYGAYDFVALAQLWGPLVGAPGSMPKWTNDLRQEYTRLGEPAGLPEQESGVHNALADARHLRVRAEWLAALTGASL